MSNIAPRSKLPALTIAGQALGFPFTAARPLLRFAIVPFLAMLSATLLLRALAPSSLPSPDAMRRIFVASPLMIVVLVEFVLPSYAVTVTNYLVAGPVSIVDRSALQYSTTEFRYAIAALAMTLSFCGALSISIAALRIMHASIPAIVALALIFFAIAIFIVTRLILVFPAIAAGNSGSPRTAWIFTRRNFWRLVTIAILTAIPYSMLTMIVRIAAANVMSIVVQFGLAAIMSAIITLSWTTTLAWQALVHKHLTGSRETFASASRAV